MRADPERRAAETPLGRAVGVTTTTAASMASHRERHSQKNSLRDVILGGQDGLVNILGIILGVIAGGGSNTVLLAAGFAAAITESISMGAVGYTSTVSERDYYEAERQREVAEIETSARGGAPGDPGHLRCQGFHGRPARSGGRHHRLQPSELAGHDDG
jgi:hypothetical protein